MQTLSRGQPRAGAVGQVQRALEWGRARLGPPLARGVERGLPPLQRYGEPVLGAATAITMLVAIWAALSYAPIDAIQGEAWRIFYFHVPVAWVAYLAFFVVFAASILYLWRKDERWDWIARAGAEIGIVFTTLTLITGSLWGRPIWGAWWT